MYISPWPGLVPAEFITSRRPDSFPYPLNGARTTAFYVARSGIYHLFRTLRLKEDDVVLVPDYHSGNEVAAMRAAGANIVFYPIRRNMEADVEALSEIARKTHPRVIYAIHYLGWSQPMDEFRLLCRQYGSILVEDCALSLLSEGGGRPLGLFGDYSVFCLYKTIPVPNGGLLVQNNPALPALGDLHLEGCPRWSTLGRTLELAFEAVRSRADGAGKAMFAAKQWAGRSLRANGVQHVPVGDIGWDMKVVKIAMSRFSDTVAGVLDYAEIRARRRRNFTALQEMLTGCVKVVRELADGQCPLFFPILVRDKAAAARALWQQGISAVEFWSDPEDGITGDALYLRRHVLELPIHQDVTPEQVEHIATHVRRLRLEAAPC